MNKHKTRNTILGGLAVLLVLGALFALGRGAGPDAASGVPETTALIAADRAYDFGEISMRDGIVRHAFSLQNVSPEALTVEKLYTSCMCTTAALDFAGKRSGPFGMPGHGFLPRIGRVIAPGEAATVEVAFDPAAHGPAGVGRIEREAVLETDQGPFRLRIAVTVTP